MPQKRNPEDPVKTLERKFEECMSIFQARLDTSQPTDITQLAADFACFKKTMYTALEVLKAQVESLTELADELDNRSRRKFLLVRGLPEHSSEKLDLVVADMLVTKLKIPGFSSSNIKSAFRLGASTSIEGKPRPVLVKFDTINIKSNVWHAKKELKNSGISIGEFLTPVRREIFQEARRRHGMSRCWSQEGIIYLKSSDGTKVRIKSLAQLNTIPIIDHVEAKSDKTKTKEGRRTKK